MDYLAADAFTIDDTAITAHAHDDVYFSRSGGLDETRHVFLNHNNLPERFAALGENTHFCIAESGFGTGLNFFAAVQLWNEARACDEEGSHLTFLSFEKFPLPPAAIRAALAAYPELSEYVEAWLTYYPHPIEGVHEIRLGNVTLQLVLGDMQQWLPQLNFEADAWFLDGFAPAKNPDMWGDEMMQNIAAHTKRGGTLATFTAVGAVRRALQTSGFDMQKVSGFGRKREMLVGRKS